MHDSYDHRVIGRIASGDEEALSELYGRHARVLYNYAARILQSADEAEDAVSAVFLSIWTGVPGWPDPSPPAGVVLTARLRESITGSLRASGRRESREVDLWAIVAGREFDDPSAEAARRAIGKCGAVSATVLSLAYFGGQTLAETAVRMSMTESECRSRLQVCLERLDGGIHHGHGGQGDPGPRHAPAHGSRFASHSAALALGVMAAGEDKAYSEHLAAGCIACAEETARYASAAHVLPRLLPDVRLPGDLLEKILFSLRLARMAGSEGGIGTIPDCATGGVTDLPAEKPFGGSAEYPGAGADAGAAGDRPARRARPARHRAPAARRRGRFAWVAGGVAAAMIILLGSSARMLSGKLEEQSGVIESFQERHTDLLLKYDRLAGISGYFETKGVVTILNGTPDYPGLAGKIIWDTTGKSAMLQILNPPGELGNGRIRVTALGDDGPVSIAEFRRDRGDGGDALYRFFPVEVASGFHARGFEVAVSPVTGGPGAEYRNMLRGEIAGRR
jgi:DNA-directed RNA polymerase specialized sigma24 family protein